MLKRVRKRLTNILRQLTSVDWTLSSIFALTVLLAVLKIAGIITLPWLILLAPGILAVVFMVTMFTWWSLQMLRIIKEG